MPSVSHSRSPAGIADDAIKADFPLIDEPLIIALLSDYAPKDIENVLPEIREQLALFEAALVPDDDEHVSTPQSPEIAPSSSTDLSELEARLGRVDMYDYGAPDEFGDQQGSITFGARSHATASSCSATSGFETAASSVEHEAQSQELDPLEFLQTVFPHL